MFEKVSKIDSQQNNAFSRSYAVRNVEKMCVCVCVCVCSFTRRKVRRGICMFRDFHVARLNCKSNKNQSGHGLA